MALQRHETLKTNHEETKSTKKNHKNLCALRFFVGDFLRSFFAA
jgi:hypothetical protein